MTTGRAGGGTGGHAPVDALVLVSFGGPEGPEDVLPFLENVVSGRGVPRERLLQVAEHYRHFGGVSPINAQNRALIAALRADFDGAGLALPIYWGNRNWAPYLPSTVRRMADDGVRHALAFVTSAYASYSACRQYRDDIDAARAEVGEGAPVIRKLRHFYNHPGFVEPLARSASAALATLPEDARPGAHLVFTAHSIPVSMATASGPEGNAYVAQLQEASRLVAERVGDGTLPWSLVWQSRSGPPSVPWLEPDVGDHLAALQAAGAAGAVAVPVGFVSDHVEVRFDLDVEAAERAAALGLPFARAGTPGVAPEFVAMVRELVREQLDPGSARRALGACGPALDDCPPDCCRTGSARPGPAPVSRVSP